MKNGKIIFIIAIILIITLLILILTYNLLKNGNTRISKSEEDIIDDILNIQEYDAKIEIEVETNKNKNKYIVKQNLKRGNISKQEVIEPSNIKGLITEYDGNNLKIINGNLDLSTTFENYTYVVDNNLWLDSFANDYKKNSNSKCRQKDDEIIMEVKDENGNKYNTFKKLYIDKTTGKPTKMIVQDINQKTLIYILYNEIEIS